MMLFLLPDRNYPLRLYILSVRTLRKKATIHQVMTMVATSKNWTLWLLPERQQAKGHLPSLVPVIRRWLWPGNRTFLEVASMVVTYWIAAFLRSDTCTLWCMCKCEFIAYLIVHTHCILATLACANSLSFSLSTLWSAIRLSSSFCLSKAAWICVCSNTLASSNCLRSCSMRRWAWAIREFSSSSVNFSARTWNYYREKKD